MSRGIGRQLLDVPLSSTVGKVGGLRMLCAQLKTKNNSWCIQKTRKAIFHGWLSHLGSWQVARDITGIARVF